MLLLWEDSQFLSNVTSHLTITMMGHGCLPAPSPTRASAPLASSVPILHPETGAPDHSPIQSLFLPVKRETMQQTTQPRFQKLLKNTPYSTPRPFPTQLPLASPELPCHLFNLMEKNSSCSAPGLIPPASMLLPLAPIHSNTARLFGNC